MIYKTVATGIPIRILFPISYMQLVFASYNLQTYVLNKNPQEK